MAYMREQQIIGNKYIKGIAQYSEWMLWNEVYSDALREVEVQATPDRTLNMKYLRAQAMLATSMSQYSEAERSFHWASYLSEDGIDIVRRSLEILTAVYGGTPWTRLPSGSVDHKLGKRIADEAVEMARGMKGTTIWLRF